MPIFIQKARNQALSLINKSDTTCSQGLYSLELLQIPLCSPAKQPSPSTGQGAVDKKKVFLQQSQKLAWFQPSNEGIWNWNMPRCRIHKTLGKIEQPSPPLVPKLTPFLFSPHCLIHAQCRMPSSSPERNVACEMFCEIYKNGVVRLHVIVYLSSPYFLHLLANLK